MATIRKAGPEDQQFLREMLYESIHLPPGADKPPFSIIDIPELLKYTDDWMKETDCGVIAELDGNKIGAAWTRQFKDAASGGYGFIDPAVPELVFAVRPDYRGRGIGTTLMEHLFTELNAIGFKKLSLSVNKKNRAVNLYKRLGFEKVKEQETDYLMIKSLANPPCFR